MNYIQMTYFKAIHTYIYIYIYIITYFKVVPICNIYIHTYIHTYIYIYNYIFQSYRYIGKYVTISEMNEPM